jgi:hypothetical protein
VAFRCMSDSSAAASWRMRATSSGCCSASSDGDTLCARRHFTCCRPCRPASTCSCPAAASAAPACPRTAVAGPGREIPALAAACSLLVEAAGGAACCSASRVSSSTSSPPSPVSAAVHRCTASRACSTTRDRGQGPAAACSAALSPPLPPPLLGAHAVPCSALGSSLKATTVGMAAAVPRASAAPSRPFRRALARLMLLYVRRAHC